VDADRRAVAHRIAADDAAGAVPVGDAVPGHGGVGAAAGDADDGEPLDVHVADVENVDAGAVAVLGGDAGARVGQELDVGGGGAGAGGVLEGEALVVAGVDVDDVAGVDGVGGVLQCQPGCGAGAGVVVIAG